MLMKQDGPRLRFRRRLNIGEYRFRNHIQDCILNIDRKTRWLPCSRQEKNSEGFHKEIQIWSQKSLGVILRMLMKQDGPRLRFRRRLNIGEYRFRNHIQDCILNIDRKTRWLPCSRQEKNSEGFHKEIQIWSQKSLGGILWVMMKQDDTRLHFDKQFKNFKTRV